MLWHLFQQFLSESLCFPPGCVKQSGAVSHQVNSSNFSYVAHGWMPKSKELLFLCRNVGTGQRSALLCCLCFSPHLSSLSPPFFPSCIFWQLYPPLFQYCLSLPNFPPLSPPCCLLCWITSTPNVSFCYLESCNFFLTHKSLNLPFFIPSLPLSLVSPSTPPLSLSSQCSCRRTQPTMCCGGCAGPTSGWRRWSRVTSRGSAGKRSAPTRKPARLSRTMRRRWGDKWDVTADLQSFLSWEKDDYTK